MNVGSPALLLFIASLLPFAAGETEKPPKEQKLVSHLLDRVVARAGVEDGALVVVPLVLVDGEKTTAVPTRRPADWKPVGKEAKTDLVSVARREGKAPIFVPGGVLLGGGVRERLLSRPLLLDAKPAVAAARFCDRREKPREAPGTRAIGRIVPLLQRKLDLLLEEEEILRDVLQVQAHHAGLEPELRRVEDLFAAPDIADRVQRLRATTGAIPRSYGEGACGYVALFGFRPVEVVLLSSPEAFVAHGPGYLHALSVSAAIWERATGWLPPAPAPKSAEYVAAAKAALALVRASRITRIRPAAKEKLGGDLFRVRPKASAGESSTHGVYAGRILVSEEGWPLLLETFEYGGHLLFPTALTKPGGRPVDEPPSVRSGAMTQEFLARLAARRAAIRGALFGR